MRGKWLLAASLALLGGCQSLEDIRASEPVRTASFAADYRELGACAADRLQGDYPINLIVKDRERLATLTSITDNGFVRVPLFELRIREVERRSEVEIRSVRTVFGTPDVDINAFWKAAVDCGAQLAQRPPS